MLDFEFLSCGATRALSQNLEARDTLFTFCDGGWNWAFDSQCGRGARGDFRDQDGICAHAEIQDRSAAQGYLVAQKLSQERGLDAVCRSFSGNLFRGGGILRD